MSKVYDVITDRIVSMLEDGAIPWHKPWKAGGWPKNLVSKKAYRGINVFMLASAGYASPYFLTFKQAKSLGGSVRKGEKGLPVIFWKLLDKKQEENEEEDGKKQRKVPFLRYYTVFNVSQCDGIDPEKIPEDARPARDHDSIESAEQIVQGYPDGPCHGTDSKACYAPLADTVFMPQPETFEDDESYYSTMFHELTHSTGHSKRLDRKLDTNLAPFGSEDYSQEELVGEMGAAFLCGEGGILHRTVEQSAAYVQGWLKALKDDRKLVVIAAQQAQKAADHILDRTFTQAEA